MRSKPVSIKGAFTLVELLTVITIIAILAGLILMASGYAQKKAAGERAKTEMASMSAACESYKADNGTYPRNAADTDVLVSGTGGTPQYNPSNYKAASKYLYGQLSGDYDNANAAAATNYDGQRNGNEVQGYMEFKRDMLGGTKDASGNISPVLYIQDPFGYSYGYSTIYQANSELTTPVVPSPGNNPTFDMWCTFGTTDATSSLNQQKWLKNW